MTDAKCKEEIKPRAIICPTNSFLIFKKESSEFINSLDDKTKQAIKTYKKQHNQLAEGSFLKMQTESKAEYLYLASLYDRPNNYISTHNINLVFDKILEDCIKNKIESVSILTINLLNNCPDQKNLLDNLFNTTIKYSGVLNIRFIVEEKNIDLFKEIER